MLLDALRESAAVARAEGAALPEDFPQKQLQMIDSLAPGMMASMAQDLLRGKRLELDWLSGAVVRRADRHGIVTPVHRAIYAALVLHA
jgi:2-dehydropantoate 2-reductase